MPVRALMVDVDGVVVRAPDGRPWYADLLADLGIDPVALDTAFFQVHFSEVIEGRADLHERLDAVLPDLGSVSSRDLVDYWFTHDAHLDEVLLTDLERARAQGLEVHLATVQEHHRARYLWHDLELSRHFDGLHYAAELGARKTDLAFYRAVERRAGAAAAELCLVDDSVGNVETARAAGWRAHLWERGSRLTDVLDLAT